MDFELKDLGQVVCETRDRLKEFNYDDVQLTEEFKSEFSKCISNSGNSSLFGKTTAIITNAAGQKIYAPNQWFVLAAYAVPLAKEVMKYRGYTEQFLDKNINKFNDAKIKDKKDIYQLMRGGDEAEPTKSMLSGLLTEVFVESFLNEGIEKSIAEKNANYLIRFMTDSKWWLGGKGIERSNDYYVSPILGVLNLVNASQSYVATMTYLYVTNENLGNEINSLTEVEVSNENPEEKNKRLFRYWLELQVKPEGDSDAGNPYSPASINSYVSNIQNTPLINSPDHSVFYTTSVGDVEVTIEALDNSEKKNNTQRSAVRKYLEYLIDSQMDEDIEELYKHNLYGIHMKNMNTALSTDNPHICIGWSELGDLGVTDSREKLIQMYEEHYDKNARARGQDVGQLWRFKNDVNIGDYVLFAEHSVFHIGKIVSDYYYDDAKYDGQDPDYVNTRKVFWLKKNISRDILSPAMHNSLKTAMSFWTMNDYKAAVVDILKGVYKKDEIEEIGAEYMELIYNTSVESSYDRNRIIFGAPGTGKSFGLKEDSKRLVGESEEQFERVTFHPDYSYSQFVGAYKPVTDSEGNIRYDFVPGPFMRIYVEALKSGRTENPKPYLLVIEEINRAKVAAVFGDVFQLLDRNEDGVSEYDVQASEDLKKYLAKELGGEPDNYKKIKIPNNMFIWATMNSADQGVFPMDTAFKRRWNFEYLGINDGEEKMSDGSVTLGNDSHAREITWNKLRKAINEVLAVDYKVNEDKLMGPFFLAKSVTESDENGHMKNPDGFIKAFKSKVIMYLYEDAAKQYKHKLFSGCENSRYSSVCEGFDKVGIEIFGDGFLERYNQQKG